MCAQTNAVGKCKYRAYVISSSIGGHRSARTVRCYRLRPMIYNAIIVRRLCLLFTKISSSLLHRLIFSIIELSRHGMRVLYFSIIQKLILLDFSHRQRARTVILVGWAVRSLTRKSKMLDMPWSLVLCANLSFNHEFC